MDTDRDVWDALRAGDADALAELLDRHGKAVYNFAFRRLSSWSAAEDVLQSTFTTLWRRADDGKLDPLLRDNALPYLLTIAGFECATALRSASRWTAALRRSRPSDGVRDIADDVAERDDEERRMRALHKAIRTLPKAQQEALELVVWAELSIADAAVVLRVPEGTVKSRLARARAALHGLVLVELEGGGYGRG